MSEQTDDQVREPTLDRNLRKQIRDGAPVERVIAALVDSLDATQTVWREVTCKRCRHTAKYEAEFRDPRTALRAAELISQEGWGRTPQAERDDVEELNLDVDVTTMSSDERAKLRRSLLRKFPDLATAFAEPPAEKPPALMIPPRKGRKR